MALNLGVHVKEQATSVSGPVTADVSVPYVVGAAPLFAAEKPAKAGVPVLAQSWDEAVEKLGYSTDWKNYPLCEFMYSHFKLFGVGPVIFMNLFDPAKATATLDEQSYPVTNRRATLPFGTQAAELSVKAEETPLTAGEDYVLIYDGEADACYLELLPGKEHSGVESLTISGKKANPAVVTKAEIIKGLDAIDSCASRVGVIPDLICAPGFSHDAEVAALMATKAEAGINGLFRAKALIDIDSGAGGVREYTGIPEYKAKNNLTDENEILCWPMVKLGDKVFHMSTQLAGLMAQVDEANGGVPFESPSNKNFQMDGCCLEDGTEVDLTFDETVTMAGYGVVTALNFLSMGWTARGNYTACYPGNTDVKDQFIPVSRMFDFVANTLIRTFWAKLDKPMRLRLLDNIQDTVNIWLNGLVSQEYLLGARVELRGTENPQTGLLSGIIAFHIYITPPVPAQEIDFTLEYDVDYLTSALNLAA